MTCDDEKSECWKGDPIGGQEIERVDVCHVPVICEANEENQFGQSSQVAVNELYFGNIVMPNKGEKVQKFPANQ